MDVEELSKKIDRYHEQDKNECKKRPKGEFRLDRMGIRSSNIQ